MPFSHLPRDKFGKIIMQTQAALRQPAPAGLAPAMGDPAVSRLLAQSRPCPVSFFKPNEEIYAQGGQTGPLYLVEFGTVRICRLTAGGRRQVTAFHFTGEIFGFESGAGHQSFAESVSATGIRVLRAKSDEGLGSGVLAVALRALARGQDHVFLLGRLNAAEKVAAFLLDLRERQNADARVDLPMQRSDIADYLGLTFETVSRVLRTFKDAGMIRLPSVSQVEIVNLGALEAFNEG